jgi:hypothetical protein
MLKYTGKGFIHMVPARDLTDEDLKNLPQGITQQDLIQSGCYVNDGEVRQQKYKKEE